MSDETNNGSGEPKSNVVQMFEELQAAQHPDGKDLYEYIYTNDHANPMLPRLFHFLYDAVFNNKVGVMHAYNKATKQVQTLIIGVELDENGNPMCLPLAKILTAEEQENYLAPNGFGGFIGLDSDE